MTLIVCQTCFARGFVCVTCGKPRSKLRSKKRFDPIHQTCVRRPRGVKPCPAEGFEGQEHRYTRCDYGGEIVYGMTPPAWAHDHARKGHICPVCQKKREVALDAIVGGLDFSAVGEQAIENLISALNRVDPKKLQSDSGSRLQAATYALHLRIIHAWKKEVEEAEEAKEATRSVLIAEPNPTLNMEPR